MAAATAWVDAGAGMIPSLRERLHRARVQVGRNWLRQVGGQIIPVRRYARRALDAEGLDAPGDYWSSVTMRLSTLRRTRRMCSRREVNDAGAIVAWHVGTDAPLVPSKQRALFEEFEARFALDAGPLHRILQFRKGNEDTSLIDRVEVVKHQNIVRIIDHAVYGRQESRYARTVPSERS